MGLISGVATGLITGLAPVLGRSPKGAQPVKGYMTTSPTIQVSIVVANRLRRFDWLPGSPTFIVRIVVPVHYYFLAQLRAIAGHYGLICGRRCFKVPRAERNSATFVRLVFKEYLAKRFFRSFIPPLARPAIALHIGKRSLRSR